MNIKSTMAVIVSALAISTAAQAGMTKTADQQHYMMHGGNGPQGHAMQGKAHDAGQSSAHRETLSHGEPAHPQGRHYMMHAGDGPQGHLMSGQSHAEGASSGHVEQYGHADRSEKRHYMMRGGDGPQGYWMDGASHDSA
ncbi:hypothetical protein [Marinobacterium arenosum]|uniref:hypothetical protein n=1 Tax=Marinobacterium arenosum TaxID=2862496 RepID=UPI001C94F08F|nr:hypothetical protein [Marinobacterium arenosum]MBY4677583.1 hypothetical protein [Marinobacterium arenosum]